MPDPVRDVLWSESLRHVLEAGGWVAWVLVAVSALFWFSVVQRAFVLSPAAVERFRHEASAIVGAGGENLSRLDQRADRAKAGLQALRSVVRSLVAAAPLLGLLGTVGGMIETFHSLGASRASEASVAGGISTALVTTQLGLMIGVLGLLAARALERKEERLARAIETERARLAALIHGSGGALP